MTKSTSFFVRLVMSLSLFSGPVLCDWDLGAAYLGAAGGKETPQLAPIVGEQAKWRVVTSPMNQGQRLPGVASGTLLRIHTGLPRGSDIWKMSPGSVSCQ